MTRDSNARAEDPAARRARYSLYGLGAVFIALAFSMESVPALAAVTPWWAGRASAMVAVLILAVGRFGSDRIVCRCEALLSRRRARH